jgi:hypothetical protein
MRGLLGQTVKPVAQTKRDHQGGAEEGRNYSFFDTDALDACFGTGGVCDYESVKPVVSGHLQLLLRRVCKSRLRQQPKSTISPKAICANYGEVFLLKF